MAPRLHGAIAPLLTPFDANGQVAVDLFCAHADWVLAEGAHFLAPFGTTGEALSIGIAQRRSALEALVASGIPADRLMPGTGVCALQDTLALTRHAVELGCSAVMLLPAFFYKDADEDGHVRYFAELIEATGPDHVRVCLYHIPSHSGVGISPSLAARLQNAFPEAVVAYKDSSGDFANTQAVIAAAPGLAVFPASETLLIDGLRAGAAGCISATCNLNARAIRAAYEAAPTAGDGAEHGDGEIRRFREHLQRAGLIRGMKALLSVTRDDDRWLNLLPPLKHATRAEGEALRTTLGPAAEHLRGSTRVAT